MRAVLVALSIVLAAALAIQAAIFGGDGDDRGGGADVRSPSRAGVLPDFRLSGDQPDAYVDIVNRPLLNPERKPAPKQAAVLTTEPARPQIRRGLYELLGVSDTGTSRIAQVREVATRRTQSVRKGDTLQELQVHAVEADRVVLSFRGERDEIRLATYTASGRVPPPPAVPVPVPSPPPAAQAAAPVSPVPMAAAPALQVAAVAESARGAGQSVVVDDREIQRLEALVAQNPTNWNRSRLDTARQQRGQPPPQ